jgi:hypothetical protein
MREIEVIFKTKEGVSLVFDGVTLFTDNLNKVREAIQEDLESNIPIDKLFANRVKDMLNSYPIKDAATTLKQKVKTVTLKGVDKPILKFKLVLDDVPFTVESEGVVIPKEMFDKVKDEYDFAYEEQGIHVLLYHEYEEGMMKFKASQKDSSGILEFFEFDYEIQKI